MTHLEKGYEFEGGDLEDAIKKALQTLNVSRETITVKVLSEGKQGLFGMEGASPSKIRVTIKKKKS